jgi:hypothetical protein
MSYQPESLYPFNHEMDELGHVLVNLLTGSEVFLVLTVVQPRVLDARCGRELAESKV